MKMTLRPVENPWTLFAGRSDEHRAMMDDDPIVVAFNGHRITGWPAAVILITMLLFFAAGFMSIGAAIATRISQ